jgi:hypothetical protein
MSAAAVLAFRPGGGLTQSDLEGVTEALPARVRAMRCDELASEHVVARVWSHDASRSVGGAVDVETGSWLALLGNPSRPDLVAVDPDELLERLLVEATRTGLGVFDGLSPPFGAIFHDARTEETHILVDRCGLQHLYVLERDDGSVWLSSSSLALAAALAPSLDPEGVAEWLGVGHFISQRTFFRGMRKLGCGERLTLTREGAVSSAGWRPATRTFEGDALEAFTSSFRESVLAAATGAPVAIEITGGLDSRLVLAVMTEYGKRFFGWTVGRPDSAELRTVAELQRRVRFEHVTADLGATFVTSLPKLVSEMHELADGEVSAVEYAPLLVAFELLAGRRTTSVSGSGGEIARGYYHGVLGHGAGPRGVPVAALARKVSRDTGSLRAAARLALLPDGQDPVAGAIEAFVETSSAAHPAAILDDFYVRSRMQRFGGRNITTTGLFCRQGLPYFANDLVDLVFSLPTELTADGRLVRRTLQALAPTLASVNLDTGVPVRPPSLRHPGVAIRRAAAKGRKGLVRYGGAAGRLVAAGRPDTVPWDAVRGDSTFREYVRDLLQGPTTRVTGLLPNRVVADAVARGLDGDALYALGLLLTLELTLRRTGA